MGTIARNTALVVLVVSIGAPAFPGAARGADPLDPRPTSAIGELVLTQIPQAAEKRTPGAGDFHAHSFSGARIITVSSDGSSRVLTGRFHSACDPDISFDGKRILFAGKPSAEENWNIYEMAFDGSRVRRITRNLDNCRSPIYLPTLYTLNSDRPWYTIAFISTAARKLGSYQASPAAHLYSCKLDGSEVRRISFNPAGDMSPTMMQNGRILFAGWLRNTPARLAEPRSSLFGLNIDGTDFASFSGDQGRRIQHMPCITTEGRIIFVESEELSRDGAGHLAGLNMRRNLHSYQSITSREDGLFHSPAPLEDGAILVSMRPADGSGTHALYRFHPTSGELEMLFDDPGFHDVQAVPLQPRVEPDGRSSVVDETNPTGKFYCLDVYTSDLVNPEWLPPGTIKRLRVLEGLAWNREDAERFAEDSGAYGRHPIPRTRLLGEIAVESDGSFNIQVPANTPIQLQTLDADGLALRTCGWIWAKNNEPRGCIGCHEDGELVPENRFVKALARPSIPLTLPPERRRTVDFRRDVMPIIENQCASPECHGGLNVPDLSRDRDTPDDSYAERVYGTLLAAHEPGGGGEAGPKYVVPGKARTSPLIWHLMGRNTSRPWDERDRMKIMPLSRLSRLGEEAKKTMVQWIDLGAQWEGAVKAEKTPGVRGNQ